MQGKKFKAICYDRPDYAAYAQRITKCASEISGAGTIDELSHAPGSRIRLAYEKNKEKGLAVYKRLCEMGGSMEYDDAMKFLGLPLPYTEQAMIAVKNYLAEKLGIAEKFD